VGRKSSEKRDRRRRERQGNRATRRTHIEVLPGLKVPVAAGQILVPEQLGPQHRERYARQLRDAATRGPNRLVAIRDRLRQIVAKAPTAELLVRLVADVSSWDPETYKESEVRRPAILVEYATWLATRLDAPVIGEPLNDELYVEVGRLLMEMHELTLATYQASFLVRGDAVPNVEDQVVVISRMHTLDVRNPSFIVFAYPLMEELFRPAAGDLRRIVGFDVDALLSVWRYIEQHVSDRMNAALDDARSRAQEGIRFAATGALDDQLRPLLPAKLRKVKVPKLREMIGAFLAWTVRKEVFVRAEELFAVTPIWLAQGIGLDEEICRRILDRFAIPSGHPEVGDDLMSRYDALDSQPLVRLGQDRYLTHLFHLWVWGARGNLEEALKTDQPAWDRYEHRRASFVEMRALELFGKILPGATIESRLPYPYTKADGTAAVGELDGLIVYGPVLLLIEAKGGPVKGSAKRGAPKSLRQDLGEVMGDAHGQAMRARDYIYSTERASFSRHDGTTFELARDTLEEVFLITVSLESLDVFEMHLAELRELGILRPGDLPWAVSLLDLEVFAELIEWGPQLIHYLRRRLPLNGMDTLLMEELDLLGAYLANGLRLPPEAAQGAPIRMTTFTEGMDDYYHFRHGLRKTPAPRPRADLDETTRAAAERASKLAPAVALRQVSALLDHALPKYGPPS
jgi:hypothetical protein